MKKSLSFLLTLALCAGLCVPATASWFSDVPSGHYAAAAIDACVEKGIASGYDDGTFRPGNTLTRAQFCVMISRAFYPSGVARNDNVALRGLGWFVPNTRTLYMADVLAGTRFCDKYNQTSVMEQPIIRYDMAQLMANIMRAGGKTVSDAEKAAAQAQIKEWSAIPEDYRDAVSFCYALGILGGMPDGSFGGVRAMNRAQGCVVIDRMSQYIQPDTLPTEVRQWPPVTAKPTGTPAAAPAAAPAETPVASGLPEIRCYGCGYLMRPAGGTALDLNNGGSSTGFYSVCDLCSRFYLCQQCSRHSLDAGLTLHRHKAVCASGGTIAPMEDFCSPYYRNSVYYQRLKSVTLTGNYRQDILAVAASQIGYTEGNDATQLDGSYGGGGDYSEYNWIFREDAEGAWCSEFASWCARQANIPTDILHNSRGACPDDFGGTAYSWNETVFAGGSYMPQPGDLMLICHSSRAVSTSDDMDHTTIVESVDWNGDSVRITVIDGNSNNSVRRHDYVYHASRGMTGYFVAPDYP